MWGRSQEMKDSYIFTEVADISKPNIHAFRVSAVGALLSYEKEIYCAGFWHHF